VQQRDLYQGGRKLTSIVSRCVASIVVVLVICFSAFGQEVRGWNFSGRFSGTSSDLGTVLKADPSLGYVFNEHFQTYAGLPIYFAKESSPATTSTTATTASNGFMNGIGNAYVGFRLGVNNPSVNFSSNLVATAPTGDKDKGFSTGRATIDWTNSFNHRFSSVTPFGDIGLANTVSDTSFFVRPFTSLGFVTHFDGGARLSLSEHFSVSGSAYAIAAAGQQTIISKIVKRQATNSPASGGKGTGNSGSQVFQTSAQTVGSADLANDHGVSGWVSVVPSSGMDLQLGYTRSMGYDLNTLFFGVGFHFGK
jgi:hypothetical protein